MCARHFFLSGRLNMEHRSLEHALKPESWLRFAIVLMIGYQRSGIADKTLKFSAIALNLRVLSAIPLR